MPRVTAGAQRRRRHKKVLQTTKGYRMTKNRLYKVAHEAMLHAGQYAFIGRKLRKRDMRRLWITRITAGLRTMEASVNYSRFVNALNSKNIGLNRKMLAHLAATDLEAFKAVVKQAEK